MSAVSWYFNRLKALSLPEMAFRSKKLTKSLVQRGTNLSFDKLTYESKKLDIVHEVNEELSDKPIFASLFGIKVHTFQIKDWSFDFYSGNTFPLLKSSKIDIRTDQYGSAKHVWEYNRMLFLPQMALKYKKTYDPEVLKEIIQLLDSWIDQNPFGIGINWYSNIEVNIRLINWVFTWEILDIDLLINKNSSIKKFVIEKWIPCIYSHCSFSYDNPSLFSSANNHLISEYAGLFIATSKWKFNKSKEWNSYAKKGLEREIQVQHTENGINREQAAEYIQFITDFFLISMIIADCTGNSFSTEFTKRIRKIFDYIDTMLDCKGNFPKYGDEDDGYLLSFEEHSNNFLSLLTSAALYFNDGRYLKRIYKLDLKNRLIFGKEGEKKFQLLKSKLRNGRIRSVGFKEDGHFFLKKQEGATSEIYCYVDAAPLGYLSIAAHGHSDALSFIMHVDGQPVFIDPGTYCYHTDKLWRKYFLSTLAHNTITINNDQQAKYIGPTLWLKHYETNVKEFVLTDDYDQIIAEHNGYKKYGVIHERTFEFYKNENRIVITDRIKRDLGKEIFLQLPFHIHPSVNCSLKDTELNIHFLNREIQVHLDSQLKWQIYKGSHNPVLGWYAPSFYQKVPSYVCVGSVSSASELVLKNEIFIK